MEEFLKGEPKVLGAVQVMIALINLSIGIIMINIPFDHREPAISLILAAPAWGPLMFIISGSLSISAGMKPTKRLVTISLVFNTISAVLAAAASIMGVISVILGLRSPFLKNEVETGIDSLMLVLNLLEFCIAVSVSAFGCKVTCCNSRESIPPFQPPFSCLNRAHGGDRATVYQKLSVEDCLKMLLKSEEEEGQVVVIQSPNPGMTPMLP